MSDIEKEILADAIYTAIKAEHSALFWKRLCITLIISSICMAIGFIGIFIEVFCL